MQPARIVRGDLAERRDRPLVALHRNDARRAFGEQRPCEASGAGADFQHCDAVERSGGARDAAGQVEVEQEVLAERLAGGKAVPANDLAQRRQSIDHFAGASAPAPTRRAASLSAAIRLAGLARPVPAMSKAVPWSGEVRTKGRPSVTLTA